MSRGSERERLWGVVRFLLLALVVAAAGVAAGTFAGDIVGQGDVEGSDDGGSGSDDGSGRVHYHGTINVTIDGERLDFTHPRFQHENRNPAFHFEDGQAQWHVHAPNVTLQYAVSTLGMNVTADRVVYNGTSYDGSAPNTTVRIEVNGDAVDPSTYVLQPGDHVLIYANRQDEVRR